MSVRATSYRKELRALGFSIDQVVHNFCDRCQTVTDLAVERAAPFAVAQSRTLDRCRPKRSSIVTLANRAHVGGGSASWNAYASC